jgi:hypothetical protein
VTGQSVPVDALGLPESEWMYRNTTTSDLVLSLDRCEHGRHSADPCFSCPGHTPVVDLNRVCGYGVHGTPITAADLIRAVRRDADQVSAEVDRLRKLVERILRLSAFTAGQQAEFRAEAGIRPRHPLSWPPEDTPGFFRIHCSCRQWEFTGTAGGIAEASRRHDDSPGTKHIVSIAETISDGR